MFSKGLVRLWAVLVLALLGTTACTEPFIIVYPPGTPRIVVQPSPATALSAAQPQAAAPATEVALAPPAPATAPLPAPTATAIPPTPTETAKAQPPTPTATAKLLAATATSVPARIQPSATPTLRRAPAAARPTATPTPAWPRELVITEADIEAGASGDAVPGLQVQGLDVQFGNDSMVISFDNLRYGFVSLRNVTVQGHFDVANGDVTFVADRIQPRNLATSAIPGFVNQALDQSLAEWYVESLSIERGALVAQVRPR